MTDTEKFNKNYFEERPWGSFEILHDESVLKVKRIIVKPGMRLSYQSHRFRSENWVIIGGQAVVTLNGERLTLGVNESIFIPVGAKHRIANEAAADVTFVEIQTGSYFGEDDIVRYEDDFHRT